MATESEPRILIAVREYRRQDFLISTDSARLDLDVIHGYLTRSWWAAGIAKETVARSLRASLCFGVYDGSRQIGFARVISDLATYAYLCDDFILDAYQGKGLGRWLMETILAHPDLQGLRRWTLIAQDARIYGKFGFKPLREPGLNLEILAPGVRHPVPLDRSASPA